MRFLWSSSKRTDPLPLLLPLPLEELLFLLLERRRDSLLLLFLDPPKLLRSCCFGVTSTCTSGATSSTDTEPMVFRRVILTRGRSVGFGDGSLPTRSTRRAVDRLEEEDIPLSALPFVLPLLLEAFAATDAGRRLDLRFSFPPVEDLVREPLR